MFGDVLGIARWFASKTDKRIECARSSKSNLLSQKIRIKEGTFDDFGTAIQVDPANILEAYPLAFNRGQCTRPGRVYLKGCREAEMFSRYLPRPNTTLFVVTGSSVHNAMPIFIPDRSIFIVKTGRAFSYGRERGCRLKRNIPRNIKSHGLLCKVLA